IDAAGHAMKHLAALGLQFATNNVYDLEDRYRDHLEAHLGPHMAPGSVLHLGSEDGNILDVSPAQIERPCDVLISGPPCPPWAGNGCKKGQEDARSHVFVKILQICILLIKCNELKMCVLENVKGVLHAQKGQTSFMEKLVAVLSKEAPEFLWSYTVLSAEAYGLPQQRTRVFLRGLRACFGPIPDPWLLKMVTEGKVERADIIVLPLDRSEDGVFNVHVCINVTPTLLTGNRYLFCMSCDIDKPRQHREFCRFLHPSERMTLQGFPSTLLPDAPATVRIQGAGNAFPAS
ncbi:hpaIIM, partial [Symbiodinium microadriaticum]